MFGQTMQPMQQPMGVQPNAWMGQAGTSYNTVQAPVMNNFLTPEDFASLQTNPMFPTKLSMLDYKRAICTHKVNGIIALEKTNNGEHRCTGCGSEFWLYDLNTPIETIEKVCKNMHDLLQSIKVYFLNVPDTMKEIYMIIGFIPKIPLLWQTAKKTFETASNVTFNGLQNNMDQNSFAVLGSIFGQGSMMPGAMWGQTQPTMVPPMAAYQMPQQPGMPMGAQPNPYGYQPQMAPQVNPMMPQQPAMMAPQAPVATPPGYVNPNGAYSVATPGGFPAAPGMTVQGPMTSPNPIGTVVPQAPTTTNGQVAINLSDPTQAPAPVEVAAPVAPVNPNVKDPTVANVGKQFAAAS